MSSVLYASALARLKALTKAQLACDNARPLTIFRIKPMKLARLRRRRNRMRSNLQSRGKL